MQEIDLNCYAIGKLSLHTLNDEERVAASSNGISPNGSNDVYVFHRLMLCHTIFYSENNKIRSRNNSICCYILPDGTYDYGQIVEFYVM